MKKLKLFVLGVSALLVLAGCGESTEIVLEEEDVIEESQEISDADKELLDETLNTLVDEIHDKVSGTDSDEMEEEIPDEQYFIDKLVKEANVSRDSIISVTMRAFEGAKKYSAFIFEGTCDEDMELYDGNIWFVSDVEIKAVYSSDTGYYSVDNVLEFANTDKSFYYADLYYATQAVSIVYGVEDGRVYETPVSGYGSVCKNGDNEFNITMSAYDYEYNDEIGFIGHTWKPYYFYYDKDNGFKEYYGKIIDVTEFEEKCNIDIIGDIKAAGGEVTDIIYRDNGIISVNYSVTDKENQSVVYNQANYDCNTQNYIDAWGDGKYSLESSGYGGNYDISLTRLH